MITSLTIADYLGTFVFAVSGALAAQKRAFDLFGVSVVAFLTALGGGTLRDLLLGVGPVTWIVQPSHLAIIVVAVFFAWLFHQVFTIKLQKSMMIFDAFGLAVFTILGAQAALSIPESTLPVVIIMSVITGVAGGVLRDIICNDVPLIFQKEIYASASAVGSLCYYALFSINVPALVCFVVPIFVTLFLRLISHQKNWTLPVLRVPE